LRIADCGFRIGTTKARRREGGLQVFGFLVLGWGACVWRWNGVTTLHGFCRKGAKKQRYEGIGKIGGIRENLCLSVVICVEGIPSKIGTRMGTDIHRWGFCGAEEWGCSGHWNLNSRSFAVIRVLSSFHRDANGQEYPRTPANGAGLKRPRIYLKGFHPQTKAPWFAPRRWTTFAMTTGNLMT
jgi:hypothetical protein